MSVFSLIEELDEVIVATSREYVHVAEEILGNLFPSQLTRVVEGGDERQESIEKALSTVSDSIDLIAVHDAVRPFADHRSIRRCLEKFNAGEVDGAILAIPANDTIKIAGLKGCVSETPPREKIWQAQTPQIFKREILLNAYMAAKRDKISGTDDASLVERTGASVFLVEGTRGNFKITYPLDLRLAKLLLMEE